MTTIFSVLRAAFFGIACAFSAIQPVLADAEKDVTFLVNAQHPPTGVVFEVAESSEQAWDTIAERIGSFVNRLRKASPAMKFAVVSHGREEFALLNDSQASKPRLREAIKALVAQEIPVQVCGTHAGWENKHRKDFPDYVDVVDAGPAQIKRYQREGYALVRVRPNKDGEPAIN